MKRILSLQNLLSLVFAIGITCFFALLYPHHLHFQEQFQLFQFDWNYALDLISVPGGLAEWLGRFCVQFFLFAWAGAIIVAFVLTAIQRLAATQIREKSFYCLSIMPAGLLLFFLFDENAQFGVVWSVLLSLLAAWGFSQVRQLWLQVTLFFLLLVPIYWAVGPVSIVFVLLSLYKLVPALLQQKDKVWCASVLIVTLILVCAIPSAAHHFVNFQLIRFYCGIHYHNEWQHASVFLWSAAWILSLLPLVQLLVRKPLAKKPAIFCSLISFALVIASGCWLFHTTYNPRSEEVMKYDFMTRFQQWNRILLSAKEKKPNNALEVTALNLALGMRGQLSEQMFEYRQNGLAGLLPKFQRDPVSPLTTAEAYYQLGMINTAQCFVFEAQEAIPNFQKSARCYKRLAQTNLIRGSYDVARKYLFALQKTLFYRDWANETLALLDNEEAINNHPEYGKLRSYVVDEDFYFSEYEIPQMLGQQFLSNRQNRLAYEYLQAAYLLTGDLEDFVQCLNAGQNLYKSMPKHFQEAFILSWSHDHNPNEKVPSYIMPAYVQGMNQYYTVAGQPGVSDKTLARQFGHTYWHYFFTTIRTVK